MKRYKRFILGIIIGTSTAIVGGFLSFLIFKIENPSFGYINQIIFISIGSLLAGFYAKDKGWLCGLMISVIYITFVVGQLIFIAFPNTKSFNIPNFGNIIKVYILLLPIGIICGLLGEFLSKLKHKKEQVANRVL